MDNNKCTCGMCKCLERAEKYPRSNGDGVLFNTVHKPTLEAYKEIKRLKNELATVMFSYYMSLDMFNQQYIELMMDDPDIDSEQS